MKAVSDKNAAIADVLLAKAAQLRRAQRVPEAIAAYQQLLALRPDLPDSWYNLALLQRSARQYEAALASYDQALRCGLRGPEEAHLNRAVIFADHLARPEAAEAELVAALRLNPSYRPALLNLGNLREDQGDRDRAVELYERVLSLDPENTLALARLAQIKRIHDEGHPLVGRIRTALAGADTPIEARATLGFALGKVLDDCASYDQAFAAYAAANDASRRIAHAQGERYDALARERDVDRLIKAFSAVLPRSLPPTSNAQSPIFICGMFRSGSTLAETVLSRHPQIISGGELDLLPAIVRERLPSFPEALTDVDPAGLAQLRKHYDDQLAASFPRGAQVTDKRPDNFLYIGLIKMLFPDARIVHTRRHALDNCLSIYFLHLDQSMPFASDLADIAHWYGQYQRLMAHWKSLYGDEIYDLDYDALIADPRGEIQNLVRYCGLEWDEACLQFNETKALVKTASVWQVREPLYTKSSGRWRHYERHLSALRTALAAATR